jgi:hypothetical protein
MKHTFVGRVEHNTDRANLYYNHVLVPQKIFEDYKSAKVKRIMCQINENEPWHGAFIPTGRGDYFIITGKDTLKLNKVKVGGQVMMTIWPDESKYGMPISPEFEELLLQDPEGSDTFHTLTDGKIRSLLFHVNKYKSSAKRIEKAVIILEHLKANSGKLDWKMLNEAFKMGV